MKHNTSRSSSERILLFGAGWAMTLSAATVEYKFNVWLDMQPSHTACTLTILGILAMSHHGTLASAPPQALRLLVLLEDLTPSPRCKRVSGDMWVQSACSLLSFHNVSLSGGH